VLAVSLELLARPAARLLVRRRTEVEVSKALAALQPLYGKDNVEIVTETGARVRGVVRSLKQTQALTRPSVKIERPDGEVVKIGFSDIAEIIDHNHSGEGEGEQGL
jgi:hypothetical protein